LDEEVTGRLENTAMQELPIISEEFHVRETRDKVVGRKGRSLAALPIQKIPAEHKGL